MIIAPWITPLRATASGILRGRGWKLVLQGLFTLLLGGLIAGRGFRCCWAGSRGWVISAASPGPHGPTCWISQSPWWRWHRCLCPVLRSEGGVVAGETAIARGPGAAASAALGLAALR